MHRLAVCAILFLIGVVAGCASPPRHRGAEAPAACASSSRIGHNTARAYPTEQGKDRCSLSPATYLQTNAGLRRAVDGVLASIVRIEAGIGVGEAKAPQDHDARPLATDAVTRHTGGSGIVIEAEGVILTAAHVIQNAAHVIVILPDGTKLRARRVIRHSFEDIALVLIDRDDLIPLRPSFAHVDVGAPVAAICAPTRRHGISVNAGRITQAAVSLQGDLDPSGTRRYDNLIESSTALEAGFSGGPVIDITGRLLGINIAAWPQEFGDGPRGYALPFDRAVLDAVGGLLREARADERTRTSTGVMPTGT